MGRPGFRRSASRMFLAAVRLTALSRQFVHVLANRVVVIAQTAVRLVRRSARLAFRLYRRLENSLVSGAVEAALTFWAIRQFLALLVLEGALVWGAFHWPWLWIGALSLALLFGLAAAEVVGSRDGGEWETEAFDINEKTSRGLFPVFLWGLRALLLVVGLAVSVFFTPSLREVAQNLVERSRTAAQPTAERGEDRQLGDVDRSGDGAQTKDSVSQASPLPQRPDELRPSLEATGPPPDSTRSSESSPVVIDRVTLGAGARLLDAPSHFAELVSLLTGMVEVELVDSVSLVGPPNQAILRADVSIDAAEGEVAAREGDYVLILGTDADDFLVSYPFGDGEVVGRVAANAVNRATGRPEHWYQVRLPDGRLVFTPQSAALTRSQEIR